MHYTEHTAGNSEEYLSRSQVASLFNVSPSTVTRWADEGKLVYIRTLGGHRRYLTQDILKLVRTLTKEERMETITTEIPKLYGDHHVSAIHQILADLPGIQSVRASAASHRVAVEFDGDAVSAETILTRLTEQGYPPKNGNRVPEGDRRRQDPAWGQLSLRMTKTNPADR